MNISEFQAQITSELKIDKTKLDFCSAENPILIQKYIDFWLRESKKLNRMEAELRILQGQKVIYYKNDYNMIPENNKELDFLMNGDAEISKKIEELNNQSVLVKYLYETIQNFRDRGWSIKNMISFLQFTEATA